MSHINGRSSVTGGFHTGKNISGIIEEMSFPIKTCAICGEEFELRPDKPGFANRCPACSEPDTDETADEQHLSAEERKAKTEVDAERRKAIRDLLYRKDR